MSFKIQLYSVYHLEKIFGRKQTFQLPCWVALSVSGIVQNTQRRGGKFIGTKYK